MYPGTDLLEIRRMAQALKRRPTLKSRLFTDGEIAECEAKGTPVASFAGRFAAKEAILKAFGTGLRGVKLLEIEILTDVLGKPQVSLYGAARELARRQNISEVRVSISHTRDLAMAFALALTREENR